MTLSEGAGEKVGLMSKESSPPPPDLLMSQTFRNTWPIPSTSATEDIGEAPSAGCTVFLKIDDPFHSFESPSFQLRDASVVERRKHVHAEHHVSSVVILGQEPGSMVVLAKDPDGQELPPPASNKDSKNSLPPGSSHLSSVAANPQSISNSWQERERRRRRRSTLSTIISTSSGKSKCDLVEQSAEHQTRHISPNNREVNATMSRIPPYSHPDDMANGEGENGNLDIEEKILRRKEMAHLFQWYYPEGGWGWVIVFVAALCQALGQGMWHFGHTFPFSAAVKTRFRPLMTNTTLGVSTDTKAFFNMDLAVGSLVAASFGTSMFLSPLITWFCRKKSSRLAGCMGGICLALGALFSSFATEFYHMFFSYGIMTGLGVGMVRDSATVMLNQYFKRRRALVEIFLGIGNGLGILLSSPVMFYLLRLYKWRICLQCVAALMVSVTLSALFYRSSTLYHPQRRAILHLKSQKRTTLNSGPGGNSPESITELKAYKNRRLHLLIAAIFTSSFGLYLPLVYLSSPVTRSQSITSSDLQRLQLIGGGAWICGATTFGYLTVTKPTTCKISKSNLCQISLVLVAVAIGGGAGVFTLKPHMEALVALYAFSLSGYLYVIKTHLMDLCKARHFALAYSASNLINGVGICSSLPISAVIDDNTKPGLGYLFAALAVLTAAAILFVSDLWLKCISRRERVNPNIKSHNRGCPHRRFVDENEKAQDGDDYYEGDEDEYEVPASWIDVYQSRFSSQAAMADWLRLEALLVLPSSDHHQSNQLHFQNFAKGQVMGEDDASVQLHENRVMLSEYEQNLLKAREELSSRLVNLDQDVTPPLPHNHNNRRKQSQITVNSDSATTSSTGDKSNPSSGGGSQNAVTHLMAGPNQMLGVSASAAALSAAVLTASASIHNKPMPWRSQYNRNLGLQYQRSIPTVIEEVVSPTL